MRVLLYSHDTYGLGHLRRNLRIAEELLLNSLASSVLITSGSPRSHAFTLPPGCDIVKLPAVIKEPDGSYRPRSLPIPLEEVLKLRGKLILGTIDAFAPDVILVDHAVTGVLGELLPVLESLRGRARRPKLAVGLRDIVDDADTVRREWQRHDAWRHLDETYDQILVYGDPSVRTTAQDLGLLTRLAPRIQEVGYLLPPGMSALPPSSPPTVLLTVGGGGDGQKLLRAYADYLEATDTPTPFRSMVVTGPFLSPTRRRELTERFLRTRHAVHLVEFTPTLVDHMRRASAVIAMTGYNTTMELLATGVPALLVPRETPRVEQRLRAERLAAAGALEWCPQSRCNAQSLGTWLRSVFSRHDPRRICPFENGLSRVGVLLKELVEGPMPVKVGEHVQAG